MKYVYLPLCHTVHSHITDNNTKCNYSVSVVNCGECERIKEKKTDKIKSHGFSAISVSTSCFLYRWAYFVLLVFHMKMNLMKYKGLKWMYTGEIQTNTSNNGSLAPSCNNPHSNSNIYYLDCVLIFWFSDNFFSGSGLVAGTYLLTVLVNFNACLEAVVCSSLRLNSQ